MKTGLIFLTRFILLTALYFICFAVVSGALISVPASQTPSDQANAGLALFVVSLLNTAVLGYVILRSRWGGWKLIIAVFLVYFGIVTVMSQIETAFFISRLPAGMLPRIILAGALFAALFSPLAVLILGKRRSPAPDARLASRLKMPGREWLWKELLIIVAYLMLYFTFGYFIAWRNPAVRTYYGGSDPGGFFLQLSGTFRDMPWLFPLQALRAVLWTALAALIVHLLKGRWLEAGLAVALSFSVVMNSHLLIPNPFMPPEVRMAHLLETTTSNFIFGCFVVWILSRGRTRLNKRGASAQSDE